MCSKGTEMISFFPTETIARRRKRLGIAATLYLVTFFSFVSLSPTLSHCVCICFSIGLSLGFL